MSTHRITCLILALFLGPAAGFALHFFLAPMAKDGSLRFGDALGPNTILIAAVAVGIMVALLIASLRPFKQ